METITIDIVSDVVCPWCYLGKARLEKALSEVAGDIEAEINWRPYQLNPDYPAEGVDQQTTLAAKLGGKENMDRAHQTLTHLGEEVGIHFNFDAIKIGPNTVDAHRLLLWAHTEGHEMQNTVAGLLFKANFEEGRNVGDHAVLLDIAEQAGLNRAVIAKLLESDADRDMIEKEIEQSRRMGVSGVPFFVFEQKYAVSGAQTPELLVGALRDIARMKAEARAKAN